MSIPLISVCIPSYNRAKTLPFALNSLIPQLKENDEIVIVDDGSTDDTPSVLSRYLKDPRIRFIKKTHTNAPDTRNRAIQEARNEWLLWLDSDDRLKEGVLSHYRSMVKKYPDAEMFYGDCDCYRQDRPTTQIEVQDFYNRNDEFVHRLFFSNPILNGGTLIKKTVYLQHGFYSTDFYRCHDYEFWCRVAKNIRLKHAGLKVYDFVQMNWKTLSSDLKDEIQVESRVLDRLIEYYSLKEIFPDLNWSNLKKASDKAYYEISLQYLTWKNPKTSVQYWKKISDVQTLSLKQLLFYFSSAASLKRFNYWLKLFSPDSVLSIIRKMKGRNMPYLSQYHLASFSEKCGAISIAEKLFSRIIQKIPVKKQNFNLIGGSCFHLGEIYLNSGKENKALKYFQKTLEYIPAHSKAKSYLNSLRAKK